jgi:hypothetical protein
MDGDKAVIRMDDSAGEEQTGGHDRETRGQVMDSLELGARSLKLEGLKYQCGSVPRILLFAGVGSPFECEKLVAYSPQRSVDLDGMALVWGCSVKWVGRGRCVVFVTFSRTRLESR